MVNHKLFYKMECADCTKRHVIESRFRSNEWEAFYGSIRNIVNKGFTYSHCSNCKGKLTRQILISFDESPMSKQPLNID